MEGQRPRLDYTYQGGFTFLILACVWLLTLMKRGHLQAGGGGLKKTLLHQCVRVYFCSTVAHFAGEFLTLFQAKCGVFLVHCLMCGL